MLATSHAFKAHAAESLRDPGLQAALGYSTRHMQARRSAAVAALPEFERLRDIGRDIKNHTLEHMDFYLDAYARAVEAAGGLVHWCSTAAEARAELRTHFLGADVGITGANFLIAETGSSVIVTNEGNGDLTQTLPRVHIAIAGIDKIVPTLEDTMTLVRLLARSATGQDISVYTTFSTGARRPGDLDGPDAYHVVLIDNGRSSMLGTEFQDMLRCIRCAACMNHCPVYGAVGGHAYGWVYPGPMGSVLTPALVGIEAAASLPNASTLCGKCDAALAGEGVRAPPHAGGAAPQPGAVGVPGAQAGAVPRGDGRGGAGAGRDGRAAGTVRVAAAGRRVDSGARLAGAGGGDVLRALRAPAEGGGGVREASKARGSAPNAWKRGPRQRLASGNFYLDKAGPGAARPWRVWAEPSLAFFLAVSRP